VSWRRRGPVGERFAIVDSMTPRAHPFVLVGLLILALGGTACKKKEAEQGASGSGSSASATGGSGEAATKELAESSEPEGITWKRIEVPMGSLELPIDPGWNLVGIEVHGKDGIVITLQEQAGIAPAQLDDYLASYQEVQRRDAPKYATKAVTKGTVGGEIAARVEGTFDNGEAFVTRDFLVFAKGKVVLIGARMPTASAAVLPGIIDHGAHAAAQVASAGAARAEAAGRRGYSCVVRYIWMREVRPAETGGTSHWT
jgi:hypothetical protein